MKPLLIIPYYNGEKYLPALLSSLDYELVDCLIIDNSQSPLTPHPPQATVHRTAPGIGFGQAVNAALAIARSQGRTTIIVANQDTIWLPNSLPILLAALAAYPRDLLIPSIWQYDADTIEPYVLKWYATAQSTIATAPPDYTFPLPNAGLPAFACHIGAIPPDGLFDPRFHMYFEDTDLIRRWQAQGQELRLVPAARVRHDANPLTRPDYRDRAPFRTSRALYRMKWQEWTWAQVRKDLLRGAAKYLLKGKPAASLQFLQSIAYLSRFK